MHVQNFAKYLRKYILRSGESIYYFQQQSDVPSGQLYRYINDMSMPSVFMYTRIMAQIMKQEARTEEKKGALLLEAHEALKQSMIERGKA